MQAKPVESTVCVLAEGVQRTLILLSVSSAVLRPGLKCLKTPYLNKVFTKKTKLGYWQTVEGTGSDNHVWIKLAYASSSPCDPRHGCCHKQHHRVCVWVSILSREPSHGNHTKGCVRRPESQLQPHEGLCKMNETWLQPRKDCSVRVTQVTAATTKGLQCKSDPGHSGKHRKNCVRRPESCLCKVKI
jgi:hypothetical protein